MEMGRQVHNAWMPRTVVGRPTLDGGPVGMVPRVRRKRLSGDCEVGTACGAECNPGMSEKCGDGFDNNCDGLIDDDEHADWIWYRDEDGDGYTVNSNPIDDGSADEEVDGDAWVAGFHFGYAGLAGADEVGDFGLGVAEGLPSRGQQRREGEVKLDVLDIFVGEVEEVLGRAELPTLSLEPASFLLLHCCFYMSYMT